MKIKCGDVVKVISGGKDVKGKVGKIIAVNRETERVTVEGARVNKKHLKPERSRKNPEGGIIELAASVHVSNVMLMSEASGRPVRVGFSNTDGKKSRVAKGRNSSGEKI